jgi:hypothetical protein
MLALATVLLRVSRLGPSFFISAVQALELLNLALPAHLLALVLFTLPLCRALQDDAAAVFPSMVTVCCNNYYGVDFTCAMSCAPVGPGSFLSHAFAFVLV